LPDRAVLQFGVWYLSDGLICSAPHWRHC